MLRQTFRPWGELPRIIGRVTQRKWSVLGSLSTEERCLAVWRFMTAHQLANKSLFIEITEQHSRFRDLAAGLLERHRKEFADLGIGEEDTPQQPLFDIDENIVTQIDSFIEDAGPSVLFDISCFPQRFFFPFTRRLMKSEKVKDLIVTYTIPHKYYDGTLAEDHRPMAHLPLFGPISYPEPKQELAIVGIGFVPLGISELVNADRKDVEFKLLFPFPPGPPFYYRNWHFLAELKERLPVSSSPVRVEAHNVSDAYDYITEFTGRGRRSAVFAPYGPKSISLAMCIFAAQTDSPVLYTQPSIYHPSYTSGVRMNGNHAQTFAYFIKLEGKSFYSLQNGH